MKDERAVKLAHNLINYSVAAKKGDKVLIEAFDVPYPLVVEIVKAAYDVGALPFVKNIDKRVRAALLDGATEKQLKLWAKHDAAFMNDMDCYIGLRGADNAYEDSSVPDKQMDMYNSMYNHPVHNDVRVKKTRWCVLRYPSPSMAQLACMSTEAFEDYYFNVCNLDYRKMDKAMDPLKALMERTDKVHIIAPGTDLKFSIKGIPAVKCSGNMNIPDGEVYTAPVKNSVNGVIRYNTPTVYNGTKFDWVELEFKDGRIIRSDSSDKAKSDAIFSTDDGAKYVGEFSFGLNPFITKAIGDILFDEKICGSIHFTPGASYDDAYNGNDSAVHWDLVLNQSSGAGGGKVIFDGVTIRENGLFVLDELKGLNPENLIK
ncbi:MAG: aminopeptidase [Clostridiales bacterium]|nr:aminopeptidase [Clostridiales bacterium]